MSYKFVTKRGYALLDVSSALQKSIRRGDAKMAGYMAIELFESGYAAYAWRRLLTISAEDCWGVITHEVEALYRSWMVIHKKKKGAGRVFLAKATILLAQCKKSRDADHLTNLVYDPDGMDEEVQVALDQPNLPKLEIPEYAYDVHTKRGRILGKTKKDFMVDEQDALKPFQPGLFDDLVERD